ncbi:MAG: DUF6446 family protein [Pseudomonadota bacterium]
MSGRWLMIGLLAFTLLFGAALVYFQLFAWYDRVSGLATLEIAGEDVPVEAYEGLDGRSSPLKLRGCFRLAGDLPTVLPADRPAPTVSPFWFDCFDARTIAEALAAGEAEALLASANTPYGFDRVVAVFPDGWAYLWRQINRCGTATFGGDPLPRDCPPPPRR